MSAIVGTVPLLPWWRMASMTDEEVEKFNRKHLVEIEMDKPNDITIETLLEVERVLIWNAAIEAAAKVCDKYDSYGAAYEIRKTLKK
jgi:hypothetical protein